MIREGIVLDLGNIRPAEGAKRRKKRVGCGPGSGHGKTATRGTKGQKARSGVSLGAGFEGGQMPLVRRVPKRGFTHVKRHRVQIVNVVSLNMFDDGTEITPELLIQRGLAEAGKGAIKITAKGELRRKLKVAAHRFSAQAREKIKAAGGTVEVVPYARGI